MFCPKCGTLSFPNPSGDITCTNYKCGYSGPANLVIKGVDGEDVDLSNIKSETKAKDREYEIIKDMFLKSEINNWLEEKNPFKN